VRVAARAVRVAVAVCGGGRRGRRGSR
jgi:hypothetical protein